MANADEYDRQTLDAWLRANTTGNAEFMAVVSAATEAIFGGEPRELSLLYTLFYLAASGNEQNVGTFERNFNTGGGAQEQRFAGGAQGDRAAGRGRARRQARDQEGAGGEHQAERQRRHGARRRVTDVLPASLSLVSATASSGTAVATVGTRTVTWDGSLANGASVTITIGATIAPSTAAGTAVSNQGTVSFDADGNGTNESTSLTDDPGVPGAADATTFTTSTRADAEATKTVAGTFTPRRHDHLHHRRLEPRLVDPGRQCRRRAHRCLAGEPDAGQRLDDGRDCGGDGGDQHGDVERQPRRGRRRHDHHRAPRSRRQPRAARR